jgi:hypothetical protein
VEICAQLEDENESQQFSAETEFYKMDPLDDRDSLPELADDSAKT